MGRESRCFHVRSRGSRALGSNKERRHYVQELSSPELLSFLRGKGIQIYARDGRLQISAPAGTLDPSLRAELTRRKTDLIALCQHANLSPMLAARGRTGKIPQTYAQQGLWLIDHFDPGNVAYNIPEAFLVEQAIDIAALQGAVNGLLERHETLRTSFYEENGDLFQLISADTSVPVGFSDLSDIPELGRDQALHESIRKEARRAFDLSRAPLIRFHLFRLSENRNVIFFNIHHIIADQRSLAILRNELTLLYHASSSNEVIRLPDLLVQYADYSLWSAENLRSEKNAKQLDYWKRKLSGAQPFLELGFSRPYPEKRTAWGATVPIKISVSIRDVLVGIGREEGASLFMTLLAAFAVLLHKQTGSQDFNIGFPSTYRKQAETDGIIGLFVNMLALRCTMGGDPNFRELLRRVRDSALEAYENSDVPFQKIVRALKIDMRSRRSALFQIMFALDPAYPAQSGFAGAVPMNTNPGTARYDLTLQLSDGPDGISGVFEYCTDLFGEESIVSFAEHFSTILHEIVRQPDQAISNIKMSPAVRAEQVSSQQISVIDQPKKASNRLVTRLFSLRKKK